MALQGKKTAKNKYLPYIVVGSAVVFLIGCSIFTYNKVKNKKAESEATNHSYASQPTFTTTEEPTSETSEPSEATSTTTQPYTISSNFLTDENAEAPELDLHTISIDNKLLTFPCSYATLKENFQLYTRVDRYGDPIYVNEEEYGEPITDLNIYARPNNGIGTVIFKMTGDSLTTSTCYSVVLSGSVSGDIEVMSIALPNGLCFGKSSSEVIKAYDYSMFQDYKKDGDRFTVILDDGTNHFEFYGTDDVFTQAILTYGKEMG